MVDPQNPNFADTPVAHSRQRLGYEPVNAGAPPALSIVTPFHAPGRVFRETIESVANQTLQQWEWVIVNDASPDQESLSILGELRESDPRIRVIDHASNRGRSLARNTGIAAARSDFVYLLDHDDLLEPGALEESLWCLICHPEYGFVNGWSVAFGAKRLLWNHGFDGGEEFLERNLVSGRVLIRSDVLEAVGGFDGSLLEGFEDWDLWLRCANRGIWGATIPEYLDWFRRHDPPPSWEDPTRSEAFRDRLRVRYPALFKGLFPATPKRTVWSHGAARAEVPFANELKRQEKRILVVLPRISDDGAGAFLLQVVELLARQGWRISLLAICDAAGAAAYGRSTTDIHVLGHFVRPEDQPRFVEYMIHSRRPEVVLVENGAWGRSLIGYLRRRCLEPIYLGFCHVDPNDPLEHATAAEAVKLQGMVERLFVTSAALAAELEAEGADPHRMARLDLGVDTAVWRPVDGPQHGLRLSWGAEPDEIVILFSGRLAAGVRTNVLARTLLQLERRGLPFRAVVIAEGESRGWLADFVEQHEISDRVVLYELEDPSMIVKALAAADVFFMPASEGTALAVVCAMSTGLPVVAADVGGHRELVTPGCGVLIEPGDDLEEAIAYADAFESLINDGQRRRALADGTRSRILARYGLDRLNQRLSELFEEARTASRLEVAELPDEDSAFDRAVECCRLVTDAELLRGARDRSELRIADQEAALRDLRSWVDELVRGREWLEEQRSNWATTATERGSLLAEQRRWIDELEKARVWYEEQERRWIGLRDEREHYVEELKAGMHWHDEQRRNWQVIAEEYEQRVRRFEEGRAQDEPHEGSGREWAQQSSTLRQRIRELMDEKANLQERLESLERR